MTVRRLIAYRALSDFTGKAAFFVVTVLAARRLSREGFGVFALGTTMGWIAAVASDFGMQMHLARSVARDTAQAGALLDAWLRARIAAAAVALTIVAAVVGVWHGALPWPALLLFALVYLVSGIVEFVYHFYRGLSRTDVESTLTLCHRLATLACAAVVLWLQPDATLLALAMLVPAGLTAAFSIRHARALVFPVEARAFPVGSAFRRTFSANEFLRDVAPIGAGILLSALYFRIDVFLLQAWRGTEAVALYNAVFRLIEALRLFPAAVLAVALPVLVRATSGRPLAQVSASVTAFGVAAGALLWTTAGWLIPLIYGPGYGDAVPAFRILALAYPLMSLNYALTHQLIGWNGHRAYAVICLAALGFNVALNARLIPALSIQGAAWATLWTEALVTAGCLAALARHAFFMPGLRGPAYVRSSAGVRRADLLGPPSIESPTEVP